MFCDVPTTRMAGWTDDQLRTAVSGSICFADVLRELKIVGSGATYRSVQKRIREVGIDTAHFDTQKARNRSKRVLNDLDVLKKDSGFSSATVRRAAKRLIPYVCQGCGNNGRHNGRPLTLQLDHRDGNRFNHCPSNLRWLCPNCHSQTETYSRIKAPVSITRQIPMVTLTCSHCGDQFERRLSRHKFSTARGQTEFFCKAECNSAQQFVRLGVHRSSVIELYGELRSKNAVAKRLGISFPTVSKILKSTALSSSGRMTDPHSVDGSSILPRVAGSHEGSSPSGITEVSP